MQSFCNYKFFRMIHKENIFVAIGVVVQKPNPITITTTITTTNFNYVILAIFALVIEISIKKLTMPANLNALIRYRQIDRCLRNRHRPCSIGMLQEACSEALGECRGIYKLVSERTIRDDLRVMKSDMLGFNAPIVVEGGYYSYSDPEYSIFNITIKQMELLKEVYNILEEIKDGANGHEVRRVMGELGELIGIEMPPVPEKKVERRPSITLRILGCINLDEEKKSIEHKIKTDRSSEEYLSDKRIVTGEEEYEAADEIILHERSAPGFTWGKVLELFKA